MKNKNHKLKAIFDLTSDKLETDLDIVKLLQTQHNM